MTANAVTNNKLRSWNLKGYSSQTDSYNFLNCSSSSGSVFKKVPIENHKTL